MDIFSVVNPDDLQRKIEGNGTDDTGRDDAATTEPDPDPSHLYRKYHRGAVLPGDPRIARWQALCSAADRVPKLAFWWVLKHESVPPPGSTLDQLVSALPNIISRTIFEPGSVGLTWRRFQSALDYLGRIGSIDAITALMIFMDECNYQLVVKDANTAKWWIALTIRGAFHRLTTFQPFSDARHRLYDYLRTHIFEEIPEGDRISITHEEIDRVSSENQRLLTLLGRLGLVGPTFREQIKLLHEYELNTPVGGTLAEIEKDCGALKPIAPSSSNTLWDTLKWLGHPATRSGRPIELPYKGRSNQNFRIANALGETTVRIPHGPDFVASRTVASPATRSRPARR